MVKRFRTKIVEIEAVRFTGDNHDELYEWTGGQWDDTHDSHDMFGEPVDFRGHIFDELHQTWISVAPGMWIVRGAKGEFYPCDDETFHWKYEEILPVKPRKPEYNDQKKCRYEGRHQGNVCFSDGDTCRDCGWTL